jgi:ribosome-associated toxin RatA of RatAB toxin-antitoxin module
MLTHRANHRRPILAAILAALLAPLVAAAVDFTPGELAALKAGKTVRQTLPSSGKGGFYGGSGYAIVDAPIAAVWEAIQDWGAYPKMFPNTTDTTELSRKGGRSLVRMKIGHPVVSVQYHVTMTRDEAKKVLSFQMVAGLPSDLDDVRGYWRLFEQPEGRTLIAYVVAVRAPMGLVNLAGPELQARAMHSLLGVPGFIKAWLEGPGRSYYR